MRDRFIGDIGDFSKYGLLRALAGVHPQEAPELSLGIVWYRVPDAGIRYLNDPKNKLRDCDPTLFDELSRLVGSNQRTVAAIEQISIWPTGTKFFGLPAIKRASTAESDPWLDEAEKTLTGCDLVFLDPDTGLEKRSRDLIDVEHCSYRDVGRFWHKGASLVIYQQQAQRKGQVDQMAAVADELEKEVKTRPWFLHFNRRTFFVIPSPNHRDAVKTRFLRFVEDWGRHVRVGNSPA